MKQINIGGSGLHGSAIALGCMRITQLGKSELTELVNKCLELGINFFDHADIYGGGKCEELFGEVLAEKPSLREQMVLQSKCGIRNGFFDFSKAHILDSVDKILTRLRQEYLDILLLHRPDTLMEPDEVAEAFDALERAGKVRYFGVSNMNPGQMDLLQSALRQKLIANQLQFSLAHTGMIDSGICVNMKWEQGMDRDGSVLEYCRKNHVTIQAWSVLQYGFFDGVFLASEQYPELNIALERIAAENGLSPAAVAMAFILRHPAKMQAIVGSTQAGRIADMAKGADITLSREDWYALYVAAGNKLP